MDKKMEELIQGLSWVTVYDPEEELSMDMVVVSSCEYEGNAYLLCGEDVKDEDIVDDEEGALTEDEPEDEDEAAAYIFKICADSEKEYEIIIDEDQSLPVTTDFAAKDFNAVGKIFQASEDYDLDVEESVENE